METKKCSKCGLELPVSEFYTDENGKPRFVCKSCMKVYNAERRLNSISVKDVPKVADNVVKECQDAELNKVPARLLISELRRRGYRGELELVTIQKVVI